MCGIAGFSLKENLDQKVSILKVMNDKLSHRGPDGEGFYHDSDVSLSHKRLAILDLNERSNQPFFDKNKEISFEEMNNLVQGMYELQGQINEYLKAAKDVFSLEFDEDKKYKEKLHDLVKNLEHWSSQLFLTCAEDPTKKITVLKE